MAGEVDGFWVAGLEGTAARMNACLTIIGTAAQIAALSAATYKRCLAYATDTGRFYYSTGAAWALMGIGSHTHASAGAQGGTLEGILSQAPYTDESTRTVNTIYQNTSGKIIVATITVSMTSGDIVYLKTGSANPPVDYRAQLSGTARIPVTVLWLPSYFLKVHVAAGSPIVVQWVDSVLF